MTRKYFEGGYNEVITVDEFTDFGKPWLVISTYRKEQSIRIEKAAVEGLAE